MIDRILTLRELEAEFRFHGSKPARGRFVKAGIDLLTYKPEDLEERDYIQQFTSPCELAQAQCIHFLCPLCFAKNDGPIGTHWVEIGLAGRGAPHPHCSRDAQGNASRWAFAGLSIDDFQLSPSIDLSPSGGCAWHGWVGSAGVPPGHAR